MRKPACSSKNRLNCSMPGSASAIPAICRSRHPANRRGAELNVHSSENILSAHDNIRPIRFCDYSVLLCLPYHRDNGRAHNRRTMFWFSRSAVQFLFVQTQHIQNAAALEPAAPFLDSAERVRNYSSNTLQLKKPYG